MAILVLHSMASRPFNVLDQTTPSGSTIFPQMQMSWVFMALPRLHLDKMNVHHAGCPHLGREVVRVGPHLLVFGHIHVGYGREDVVFDPVRQYYGEIVNFETHEQWNLGGWLTLLRMVASVPRLVVGKEVAGEERASHTHGQCCTSRSFRE
jgi:hypothetical protein